MSITYALEKWDDYCFDMQSLLESTHAPEAAAFQDKMIVGLDTGAYQYFDHNNKLSSVIVRDNAVMIGYHITLIHDNIHFKTLDKSRHIHSAQVLQYFIDKSYRNRGIGSTMFRFAERTLTGLGIEFLMSEAKSNLPYARVFRALNWQETATNFAKWLGE